MLAASAIGFLRSCNLVRGLWWPPLIIEACDLVKIECSNLKTYLEGRNVPRPTHVLDSCCLVEHGRCSTGLAARGDLLVSLFKVALKAPLKIIAIETP